MTLSQQSTIYALASGRGKAGVAVVRISGPNARHAVARLTKDAGLPPRVATLVTLQHQQCVIDRALALVFPAPNSFTGEDVVELHTHGSPAILSLLFDALKHDARPAEAGEFSRRAFLNGKFDLVQAEGLADLIDAETASQHTQAMRQLSGEMSDRLHALREAVIEPLALLEAYIDFPDEEIPPSVLAVTQEKVAALRALILQLLADGKIGEKIRDGIEVVIFGPPNAGKSSLINYLSRRELAIVSSEPGTTRDMLEAHLDIGGYDVTLVDTAGLREGEGEIESEGIRRATQRAHRSDLKICMLEAKHAAEQYQEMLPHIDANTLIVINKTDLAVPPALPARSIHVSVKEGKNMNSLIEAVMQKVQDMMGKTPSPLITQARHRNSLEEAAKALDGFSLDQPLELACESLRQAAFSIGKITGNVSVDELLDVVFSRFCIGK